MRRFILLVLGTIALCFALFLIGSLHFAVEDGARCASVKTSICADSPTTIAYTQSRYLGPNVSPTFTYNNAASCGPGNTGNSGSEGRVINGPASKAKDQE